MKLLSVILILNVLTPSVALCQEQQEVNDRFVSISGLFESPQYLMSYSQQFNYGSGVLISQNAGRIKFSTGLYLSSKKYFLKYTGNGIMDRTTYSMLYYNIPVRFGVDVLSGREVNWKLFISSGFEFNIPGQFHSFTYYNNDQQPVKNDEPVSYNPGTSVFLELQLHRKLNERLMIFCQSAFEYKVQLDELNFDNSLPQWHPVYSNDRNLFEFGIGLEVRLTKGA